MRVSHSAISRYTQCARSYFLHYIEKIRPDWTTSALLFGSAMDLALNDILLKTGNDPYETFLKSWTTSEINKKPINTALCNKIVYTAKDFDIDLFTHETYEEISERVKSGEVKDLNYDDIITKKAKTGWHSLSEDEQVYHNMINWYSLRNKARYLIDAYIKDIMPRITDVTVVQSELAGDNGAGDTLVGFIDLVATVEGYGKVILDNKTSASKYKEDKVRTSKQLALYSHLEGDKFGTNKIGFIVLVKNLKKDKIKTCTVCGHVTESTHKTCNNEVEGSRCNGEFSIETRIRAETQMMIEEVLPSMEDETINEFDTVVTAIKAEHFPMAEDIKSCELVYGSRCQYYDLCHKGSMNNLVDMKKEEK